MKMALAMTGFSSVLGNLFENRFGDSPINKGERGQETGTSSAGMVDAEEEGIGVKDKNQREAQHEKAHGGGFGARTEKRVARYSQSQREKDHHLWRGGGEAYHRVKRKTKNSLRECCPLDGENRDTWRH